MYGTMDDSVHMTILTPQPSRALEGGGDDDDEDARVWHTKMRLFDHQKTMIRAMSHVEQTHCVRSSRPHEDGHARRCIYTNVGINSDLTSAGKTLTVLSLIRSQATPSRSKHIVHADSNHFYEVDETERTDVNINLIIVKHSLVPQWQQSLEQLTVNPAVRCDVVNKTQHLHDITPRILRYVERATRVRVGSEDDVSDEEDAEEDGDHEPRDRQWIILLSSTFVAQFVRAVVNVQFRAVQLARIVVDEPHTLTISASFPFNANFIWFLCATPMQFITSGRTYLRRVFGNLHARTSYERVLKLCLRNEDEFVYQSLNLPPIEYNHVRCIGSRVVESIRSYIPSTALRHLNAGDTDGAIRSLRCNTGTESSVLSSLTHYYNRELMNFEARRRFYEEQRVILVSNAPSGAAAQETLHTQRLRRVDGILATLNANIKERTDTITAIRERATGDCVICYEENLAERSICPHCNNVYCLSCIIRSLQQQSTCPMCRHALRPEELLTVVPDNNVTSSSRVTEEGSNVSSLQNKEDALQSILREAREDQRFLIFSEYDATFQTLSNALGERFEYTILKGPSNQIQRKLRMFRSGAVPIIMLNGAHFGSGMDLSAATDIIIYHELTSPGLLKQVIGRAQRIGRSTSLRVTRLLYDGERIEQ